MQHSTVATWIHDHGTDLIVAAGGVTGALWETGFRQIWFDLVTVPNIEGAIVVGMKAFIGASVALGVKKAGDKIFKPKKQK